MTVMLGSYDAARALAAAIGATVASVSVTSDFARRVELGMVDGRVLVLELEGGCCSQSYFSDVRQFDELIGAKIQAIEDRDGESREGLDDEDKNNCPIRAPNRECVSWHFLVFVTDKGHVTIDWRNDSNGFYDGSVNAGIDGVEPE